MKKKLVCAIFVLLCVFFAAAETDKEKKSAADPEWMPEPDSGKFLPKGVPFSASNFYGELSGHLSMPLPFSNQNSTPMTGIGGGFSAEIGYNWGGWLFGLEYSLDSWGAGTSAVSLMNNFTSNMISVRIQRVLSQSSIKAFPRWLEIVPGISAGVNMYATDYYRTEKDKQKGNLTRVRIGDPFSGTFIMKISLEAAFHVLNNNYLIPYAGIDLGIFGDQSRGAQGQGGLAMYPRFFLGIRTYPLGGGERTPKQKADVEDYVEGNPVRRERVRRNLNEEPVVPEGAADIRLSSNLAGDLTPDGDGINDVAEFFVKSSNLEYEPEKWTMEILDAENHLVRNWGGEGTIPEAFTWDGLNESGELPTSANIYTGKLTVMPDSRDREKYGVDEVVSFYRIRTGVILEEVVPKKQWRIVAAPIHFDPDLPTFNNISAEMRQENIEVVDAIADKILDFGKDVNVLVEGYANNVSNTEEENIRELIPLSQARAEAVKNMLYESGVRLSRLSAVGMGGANPLAAWEDTENWWRNRRVEFVLTTR